MSLSKKFQLVLLGALYVAGAALAWYWMYERDRRVNTPEVKMQRLVNTAIANDLCSRLDDDLDNFKKNPNTFRRTVISTLEAESRSALRILLKSKGVPENFPIEYTSSESRFHLCPKSIAEWLEIPSTSKISKSDERLIVDGKEPVKINHSSLGKPHESSSNKKVALVVGNSQYRINRLSNPTNDADDVDAALKKIGFEVINLREGTTESTRSAVDHFFNRLMGNDVGLIYLSGHGVEYQGRNYFLPVNTAFNDPDEIPRIALDITQLIGKISKSGDKLAVLVVDACRSSPIKSSERNFTQGLSKMPDVSGALIAFSTSPGKVAEDGNGRNSPYTKHLVANLQKPGLRIEDVFKNTAKQVEIETAGRQIPWYSSNLRAEISLH